MKLIFGIFFITSCYSQTVSSNDILLKIFKQQQEFFTLNECNRISDENLLYFAEEKRQDFIDDLIENFPELADFHNQEFFLIETCNTQSGSFYNYLIVNETVYNYHWIGLEGEFRKVPIDEFKKDRLDNFVILDILEHKSNWANILPEKGVREVLGGSCFFVVHVTWEEQQPKIEMALFDEYSPFK